MHVLVSFCNVKIPRTPRLAMLDLSTSELKVLSVPEPLPACAGITGLALSDRFLFVAAQDAQLGGVDSASWPSTLVVLDRSDLSLRGSHTFERASDVHSLWFEGDRGWAVSTGTDEVVELRLDGPRVVSETTRWSPRRNGSGGDMHHLNGICRHDGRLVVSGFGPKARKGRSWGWARDGFVFDLDRGESLLSGIYHPHSVAESNGALVWCESGSYRIRSADGRVSPALSGYTRGLAHVDGSVLVGASKARRVSKSTGRANHSARSDVPAGSCSIWRLSASSWEVEEVLDARDLGTEIYDILPVDDVDGWPVVDAETWRRETLRELWASVEDAEWRAKRAAAKIQAPSAASLVGALAETRLLGRPARGLRAALRRSKARARRGR